MNQKHNFVFWGTDEFSVKVLETLKFHGLLPSVVITRIDKPVGRKQILTSPPVKLWSQENNIDVLQPEKLIGNNNLITEFDNSELAIVASYGKIIPKTILNLFPRGVLNVHPSLLPIYRGPTPFQTALLNGDAETGVSIMLMDEEMDHGSIIKQVSGYKLSGKSYEQTANELATLGGEMLSEVIPKWMSGEIKAEPQNHLEATYTKKFTIEDAFINPALILRGSTAQSIDVEYAMRQVQALNPEPGTWTKIRIQNNELRIKVLSAKIIDGKLVPIRIIPAGKKEMDWEEFKRGNKLI